MLYLYKYVNILYQLWQSVFSLVFLLLNIKKMKLIDCRN